MLALVNLLQKDGYSVQTMGLLPQEEPVVHDADAILLPYPYSVDEGKIPSLTGRGIELQSVLADCRPDTQIIAGRGYEERHSVYHRDPPCGCLCN